MFLDSFINIIGNHMHIGYVVIFLISFSESLAFIGLLWLKYIVGEMQIS